MKKLLLLLALVSVSLQVLGQTDGKNYVKTTTFQVATQDASTSQETQATLSDDEKIEVITYFDGLGRPEQSISKQAGGNKQDIITPIIYDAMGRQAREYMPYADALQTAGGYLDYRDPTSLLTDINTYYTNQYPNDILPSSPNPFSEKHFESSPLNRVLEQGAPGQDWAVDFNSDNDHTIKFKYDTNTLDLNDDFADNVINYDVIFPNGILEEPVLYFSDYYEANELYKTETKDENWNASNYFNHLSIEYKNKNGQVILKRIYDESTPHDTYYIYDDYGNLTYVLSPEGSDNLLMTNNYEKFTQKIGYTEFIEVNGKGNPIVTGTGNVIVSVNPTALLLTIDFDLHFDTQVNSLLNGKIIDLDGYVPDMLVGNITSGQANYLVSIVDGSLHINGTGVVQHITDTFTVSLPTLSPDLTVIDDLCYQYHYDSRNRLVEKKIPGKGWEYIVYNTLNKPVLTQDANLRIQDDWLFTKYDALGRIVYTGKHHFIPTGSEQNSGRKELQDLIILEGSNNHEDRASTTINGLTFSHTNKVIPKVDIEIYTINYYDTYPTDMTAVYANPGSFTFNGNLYQTTTQTKTLSTGSRVRVLGTDNWINSVTFYDEKARPIYSVSKNDYLNTLDISVVSYDFVGKILETETKHTKPNQTTIVIDDAFSYDHAGRLLKQKQQINNEPEELIVLNSYDRLGQLENKGVGGIEESPLQTVDYNYNIRGWLKQINNADALDNDLFSFGINYNTSDFNTDKLFNGNISETIWRTKNKDINGNLEIGLKRAYSYAYDGLNRIKSGVFEEENIARDDYYNLKEADYDKNGNIIELRRSGVDDLNNELTSMDDLSYNYQGNQLTDVKEKGNTQYGFIDNGHTESADYEYDVNGNMVKDNNKDIHEIIYNHLNLPTHIYFDLNNDNTPDSNNSIKYVYDATGIKIEKIVNDNNAESITKYANNFIYEETAIGEELKFFNQPEGYVELNNGNFDYIYQYKDHLGNIRLSYELDDVNSVIIEEDYENSTYDWATGGSTSSLSNNNQKLNFSAENRWNKIFKLVNFTPNETVHIEFDFDKGDMVKTILFIKERINGVWESNSERDSYILEDGHFEIDLNLPGDRFRIYFEKGTSTDNGIDTTCYIDNLVITQNILEIVEENNYYPFGLKHKGYNNVINGTDHKYGFGGKEEQDELGLGWIDITARNYDAALGRWMNHDPLAEAMEAYSPYTFAFNNPMLFIDPDGALPWPIHLRSFISTPTTGGGLFRGDGRGASTASSPEATSRVRSTVTVDPQGGPDGYTTSNLKVDSDPTVFYGAGVPGSPGYLPPAVGTSDSKMNLNSGNSKQTSSTKGEANVNWSHSGKDPLTPQGVTPALDAHINLNLAEDLDAGTLTITGEVTGDSFPSTEAFITDQSGNTNLLLGASLENGGLLDLVGDNKNSLFKINMTVNIDKDGNFTGVTQGDETYSVKEWNSMVQEQFKSNQN